MRRAAAWSRCSALGALGRDAPFWIRLEYRILDGDGARRSPRSGLHAAGADRRVEPAAEDRVIVARARGGPIPEPARGLGFEAMTLRNRLIAAFLASTLLPLAATVWITTSLLDRSLRLRDNRRARSAVADARRHREAVLPARARRAEAGRARRPGRARRCIRHAIGALAGGRATLLGERRARALRRLRHRRRSRRLHAARGRRRDGRRRDLQPRPGRRPHGAAVARSFGQTRQLVDVDRRARSAARIHADAARCCSARRGSCRCCRWSSSPTASAGRCSSSPRR